MPIAAALTLASVSGGIAVLGWAPLAWWWLTILAYAALFYLLNQSRTAIQAGLLGLGYGLALQLIGHGWVLEALHRKSGMALAPAALSSLIFAIYLALFSSLPCVIWRVIMKAAAGSHFSCAVFASLMTQGEWGRSLPFNGFTSLSLGYALVDTWLAGYTPIAGVYGMSWLGYYFAASLVLLLTLRRPAPALILAAILGSGCALFQVDWVQANGQPLSYRLIQANVAQERKFDPLSRGRQMQRLVANIEHEPADLIVTPETAFTVFLTELLGDILSRLQRFSQDSGSHLFLGIATLTANAEGHNSVIHLAPGINRIGQYDKVRLMPFGEYGPAGFGWFSSALAIPLKDLSPGRSDQQAFQVGGQGIGTLICHEDLIGEDSRRWLPSATLLINPSNLAWFEGSSAIAQRLQIVRLRAMESGRPILRANNTGITAQIDQRGRVIRQLPKMQEGTLSGKVQAMQGLTPSARFGDWPFVLGSLIFLRFCLATKRMRGIPRAIAYANVVNLEGKRFAIR